ncbi:SLBB domain-containing protein [Hydrogenimonas thermophila]|uniref:polysaccharide biosynthesis/export family protein n=1 Tax=Hydrogenimonas thermophila TaxID=223786 RepID=UPI0029371D2A|nr:polysaccharide biosynthesis/export family protein [Hydrogenimonas thermophila]WOE69440.1 SLBB domain-containing protein [Hydrogenimonas thermophila]WOE71950.1 SLBB domain-containing protein [Hydrogenimonas thermophila]
MRNILIIAFLLLNSLFAVDITMSTAPVTDTNDTSIFLKKYKVFGGNLFNGSFSNSRQYKYNPEYRINIGDIIKIKFWGAYEAEIKVTVDTQGNIFIPKVGTIYVLGTKNEEISKIIKKSVENVYKKNVYVYANLDNYQPVSVFVTGNVNKPGLYEGLSSDSIIQFLDKAKGIRYEDGSFRNITILRDNQKLKEIDLYEFLLNGKLGFFQFKNGDVIFVDSIKNYVTVDGEVRRPYRFELKKSTITLAEISKLAIPNEIVTNVIVSRWTNDHKKIIKKLSLKDNPNYTIKSGDEIEFIPDYNSYTIEVNIEGEHQGSHKLVVAKGTTLQDVIDMIEFSPLSNKNAIQLFRKSVAKLQKQLIESQLRDLESMILTTGSATTEEAIIRKQESQLVLNFIQRAKKVEPKGRVYLNGKSDFKNIVLEDQDIVYIPKKSNIVTIQGEVKLPGAQTYVKDLKFDDYIKSVGGFNFRADKSNILIIRQNGKVFNYDLTSSFFSSELPEVKPGDSILVLGKPDTKNLQVTKDITQIIYQIAVGAAVVLRAF